jgi:hypothetical protein
MPDVTVFMTFLVPQAALDRDLAEHRAHRLAQRLGSVEHEQHPLLGIQPPLDQIRQQRGRDRRVLRAAFPESERDLDALGGDPERDDHHPALQLQPVEHHHRQAQITELAGHQLAQRLASALHERSRHRRLRRRPRPHLDLLADWLLGATVPARGHAGEHPLQHNPPERIAISEMLIRPKRHLSLAVSGPHPRSANVHATTTERHLAVLVTVPHRGPVGIVLALQTDDVVDLLFHQLAQHAQPDTDAQREQSLLRCPDQLPQRLLHALWEHDLLHGRLRDRYVATHGGSSLDLCGITANAPIGSGRGGGTAVTSKFYEPRDNLGRF